MNEFSYILGTALIIAGLWLALIYLTTTTLYKYLNGDKYGVVKRTLKLGLTFSGCILGIGVILRIINICLTE